MEISDDDNIQAVHPLMSENMDKEVYTKALSLFKYSIHVVFIGIDRTKRPNFPLSKIPEHQFKEVSECMQNQSSSTAMEWWLFSFCLMSTL